MKAYDYTFNLIKRRVNGIMAENNNNQEEEWLKNKKSWVELIKPENKQMFLNKVEIDNKEFVKRMKSYNRTNSQEKTDINDEHKSNSSVLPLINNSKNNLNNNMNKDQYSEFIVSNNIVDFDNNSNNNNSNKFKFSDSIINSFHPKSNIAIYNNNTSNKLLLNKRIKNKNRNCCHSINNNDINKNIYSLNDLILASSKLDNNNNNHTHIQCNNTNNTNNSYSIINTVESLSNNKFNKNNKNNKKNNYNNTNTITGNYYNDDNNSKITNLRMLSINYVSNNLKEKGFIRKFTNTNLNSSSSYLMTNNKEDLSNNNGHIINTSGNIRDIKHFCSIKSSKQYNSSNINNTNHSATTIHNNQGNNIKSNNQNNSKYHLDRTKLKLDKEYLNNISKFCFITKNDIKGKFIDKNSNSTNNLETPQENKLLIPNIPDNTKNKQSIPKITEFKTISVKDIEAYNSKNNSISVNNSNNNNNNKNTNNKESIYPNDNNYTSNNSEIQDIYNTIKKIKEQAGHLDHPHNIKYSNSSINKNNYSSSKAKTNSSLFNILKKINHIEEVVKTNNTDIILIKETVNKINNNNKTSKDKVIQKKKSLYKHLSKILINVNNHNIEKDYMMSDKESLKHINSIRKNNFYDINANSSRNVMDFNENENERRSRSVINYYNSQASVKYNTNNLNVMIPNYHGSNNSIKNGIKALSPEKKRNKTVAIFSNGLMSSSNNYIETNSSCFSNTNNNIKANINANNNKTNSYLSENKSNKSNKSIKTTLTPLYLIDVDNRNSNSSYSKKTKNVYKNNDNKSKTANILSYLMEDEDLKDNDFNDQDKKSNIKSNNENTISDLNKTTQSLNLPLFMKAAQTKDTLKQDDLTAFRYFSELNHLNQNVLNTNEFNLHELTTDYDFLMSVFKSNMKYMINNSNKNYDDYIKFKISE